jgi:hypothetical protein
VGCRYARGTCALTPLFSVVVNGHTLAAVGPEKARLIPTGGANLKLPLQGGSTLDARTPSLRLCCEPACDAGIPLVEFPVDFAFT